jgi:hypothetical protein
MQAGITATYLPGVDNIQADGLSRLSLGDNWKLSSKLFEVIQSISH